MHAPRLRTCLPALVIGLVAGTAAGGSFLLGAGPAAAVARSASAAEPANNVCGLVDPQLVRNAGVSAPGVSTNPIGPSGVVLNSCQWGTASRSAANRILVVTIESPQGQAAQFRTHFEKDAPGTPVKIGSFARAYFENESLVVYVWSGSSGIQVGLSGRAGVKQSAAVESQVVAIARQLVTQPIHIVATQPTTPPPPSFSHVNSSVTVTIGANGYSTRSLALAEGDSVGFKNTDQATRTVTFVKPQGALIGCTPDPVVLRQGEEGICYYETPGTFTYLDPSNSSPAFRGTITVTQCCTRAKFLTAPSATFAVGLKSTFAIQTSGVPHPTVTESGALPPGLVFSAGTQGAATISGRPTGRAGRDVIVLSAGNAAGPVARQSLTIRVTSAPTKETTTSSAVGSSPTTVGSSPTTGVAAPTSGFPWWIVAVLAAAAVIGASLFWRRRRSASGDEGE